MNFSRIFQSVKYCVNILVLFSYMSSTVMAMDHKDVNSSAPTIRPTSITLDEKQEIPSSPSSSRPTISSDESQKSPSLLSKCWGGLKSTPQFLVNKTAQYLKSHVKGIEKVGNGVKTVAAETVRLLAFEKPRESLKTSPTAQQIIKGFTHIGAATLYLVYRPTPSEEEIVSTSLLGHMTRATTDVYCMNHLVQGVKDITSPVFRKLFPNYSSTFPEKMKKIILFGKGAANLVACIGSSAYLYENFYENGPTVPSLLLLLLAPTWGMRGGRQIVFSIAGYDPSKFFHRFFKTKPGDNFLDNFIFKEGSYGAYILDTSGLLLASLTYYYFEEKLWTDLNRSDNTNMLMDSVPSYYCLINGSIKKCWRLGNPKSNDDDPRFEYLLQRPKDSSQNFDPFLYYPMYESFQYSLRHFYSIFAPDWLAQKNIFTYAAPLRFVIGFGLTKLSGGLKDFGKAVWKKFSKSQEITPSKTTFFQPSPRQRQNRKEKEHEFTEFANLTPLEFIPRLLDLARSKPTLRVELTEEDQKIKEASFRSLQEEKVRQRKSSTHNASPSQTKKVLSPETEKAWSIIEKFKETKTYNEDDSRLFWNSLQKLIDLGEIKGSIVKGDKKMSFKQAGGKVLFGEHIEHGRDSAGKGKISSFKAFLSALGETYKAPIVETR